jgi:predicted MFS family arabinose efflux permease
MTSPPASPRSSRSALGVLFLTVFLDLLGFGLVIPLLPLYAKHLAVSEGMIGGLFSIYSAMQFLFAPVWGMISDRIGRRPVILISVFGTLVANALMAVAQGPVLLFVARGFAGLCGANLSTAQAYIADVTTAENRTRGMGMIGAAFGLGFVLGPALAGISSKHLGLAAPFWIASGLAALNLLWAAVALPEPPRHSATRPARRRRLTSLADAFRIPQLGPLLLIFFLVTFAFAGLEVTFSLWVARPPFLYDRQQVGLLFTYIGVVMSLVQGGLVGRLSRRLGEARLVHIATALLALGLLALPLAHGLAALLVVILPITVGTGLNNPATSSLVSRLSPAERQGEMLGVSQSMGSMGRIFGPWVGTALFNHVGVNVPYRFSGAVLAVACLLAVLCVRGAGAQSANRV